MTALRRVTTSHLALAMLLIQACRTTASSDQTQLTAIKHSSGSEPEVGSSPDLPKVKSKGLKLVAYDSDGIEKYLKPADGSNNLPTQLQGILVA